MMHTKMIAGGALTALVLATGTAGMVSAQSATEATGLTEEQIIAIALAEVPGEVLETEAEQENGALVYEVEIRDADGTEMVVEINAQTGDVLEVEADDQDCGGKDDRDDDDADEV